MQVVLFDHNEIEKQIKLAAIGAKYQDVLNDVAAIEFDRSNVAQDLLAPARQVLESLKAKKDEIKRPHLDANAKAEEIFKELAAPLERLIKDKVSQKAALARQIEAEQRQIEAEKRRIKEVTEYINHFYNESIKFLLKSDITSKQISSLEMRIGSELSRKAFYGSLYDTFVEKTNNIREKITERKEFVRRKEKLDKELVKNAADEEKVAEILEEKEDISIWLLQNKTELQQEAVISAAEIGVMVGEQEPVGTIAARKQWSYEVTDIHELYKRHPELVNLEPNAAAIRAFSTSIRNEKENKDKVEINLPGIRLYQEKRYK
jgi:hypothetical protein